MSKPLRYVEIVQEHLIQAPKEKVYKALIQDTGMWWPHVVQENAKVYFEPKLGGRFYEESADGSGMLYATVRWIKEGEEIELQGSMGWDGPVTGVFSYTLEARGQATVVKLEHKFFGPVSDETEGNYVEGWKEVLGEAFKNYVEKGVRSR